jgi:hypothetical protein
MTYWRCGVVGQIGEQTAFYRVPYLFERKIVKEQTF